MKVDYYESHFRDGNGRRGSALRGSNKLIDKYAKALRSEKNSSNQSVSGSKEKTPHSGSYEMHESDENEIRSEHFDIVEDNLNPNSLGAKKFNEQMKRNGTSPSVENDHFGPLQNSYELKQGTGSEQNYEKG